MEKKLAQKSYHIPRTAGFTLIELLIVIVIIGILAGVLISVINPAAQQNKAKDANVKAAMSKVSLATESFISAYGRAPYDHEFLAGLQNTTNPVSVGTGSCALNAGSDFVCDFTVTGSDLPAAKCNTTGWQAASGGVGGQCYYRYLGNTDCSGGTDTTAFIIYAKSFGISDTAVFRYCNKDAQIKVCDATGSTCF